MSFKRRVLRLLPIALLVACAIAPIVRGAALSNYLENKYIDFIFRAQAFSPPATTFVALYTTCPTAAGGGTEVSGGSYARVSVTAALTNWAGTQAAGSTTTSSGTTGQTSNNNAITFPAPTGNWGTVACFGDLDASTSGNLLWFAPLTVSQTITSGAAAPSFAAAALTYTIN